MTPPTFTPDTPVTSTTVTRSASACSLSGRWAGWAWSSPAGLSALALIFTLTACAGPPGPALNGDAPADPQAGPTIGVGGPVAYVNGRPVTLTDLQAPLLEAAGGDILAEWVLDEQLRTRFARRGLTLEEDAAARERALLLESLDEDADQAQRLLNEIRRRQGLGPTRFGRLLERNAALRRLVADEVDVSQPAIEREFEQVHGPRYETRLILVGDAGRAADIVRRARAGEPFVTLATRYSEAPSRSQGGYLGAVSLVDAQLPVGVRRALPRMAAGEVSDPVLLEEGYAILMLERKIEGDDVELDDVRSNLIRLVRLRSERILMARLARTLMYEADVSVLDPALQASWADGPTAAEPVRR